MGVMENGAENTLHCVIRCLCMNQRVSEQKIIHYVFIFSLQKNINRIKQTHAK